VRDCGRVWGGKSKEKREEDKMLCINDINNVPRNYTGITLYTRRRVQPYIVWRNGQIDCYCERASDAEASLAHCLRLAREKALRKSAQKK
jgi:hypothetical protein